MKTVFSKNLRAFIEHEGLRQQDVADQIGVTITSLSGWLNRGVQPRAAVIASIEEIYGLTDDDLFSESNGLYAKLYGLVPNAGEKHLPPPIPPKQASLPMMAAASDLEERHMRMVELPASVATRHPSAFFVAPADGGMNLTFPANCLVLVDPDEKPADGGVAAIAVKDGGYILRRVKRGASTLMLCPESNDTSYDDILVTEKDGRSVVGTAVWYQPATEI